MSIARALPYLLMAVLLGAAGYLAGALTDPFAPAQRSLRGELSAQEPRLRRELEEARSEAADLTGELRRAQDTIDRLRADLAETRSRIAELQARAETAEQARAEAEARLSDLTERVAALEADAEAAEAAQAAAVPESSPESNSTTAETVADSTGATDTADAPATSDDAPTAETEAASDNTSATDAAQPADPAAAIQAPDANTPSRESEVANAGPAASEADPRPGADALSAINPTIQQANRLVTGVQAYQDAEYQEAFLAWLPLAQAGYARAQLHLGALFLEGRGTDRNDPLAYAWLTIARENGSQNAGPLLDRLRDRMVADDLDTARRLLNRARQTTG